MKKILLVAMLTVAMVAGLTPAMAIAQTTDTILTDYDLARISFGNSFTNQKVVPVVAKTDKGIHAPVASLAELANITSTARYQGMIANVDTALYFYDDSACPGGSTSPDAVATDDVLGCWFLLAGSETLMDTLALTTTPGGASYIGVYDVATYFTGTTVEAVLAELGLFDSNLGLTTNGNGASMVGVEDVGTYFTGTDVEAVLQEVGLALSDTMTLIETPVEGSVATVTALGGVTTGGVLLADLATTANVAASHPARGAWIETVTS